MELIKQSELSPVSFEKQKDLTKSQKAIYELLVKKAAYQEILKQVEIIELYLSVDKRTRWISKGYQVVEYPKTSVMAGKSYSMPLGENVELTVNDKWYHGTKARALQWFKNNLASCIIKGKILALPIIETE